jgi:hypothetical protein
MSFRVADWPLRIKLAALLASATMLPLGLATAIGLAQARAVLFQGTGALLAARGDTLAR